MSPPTPANEFSRILVLEDARGPRVRFAIEASPTECAALARRFDLRQLERLTGEGEAVPEAGGRWRLRGALSAAVVQTCVITLEPVASEITDQFEIEFAPPDRTAPANELDLVGDDAEPVPTDGRLDVGEIVAQQLSLALDPFPRKPGAVWGDGGSAEDAHRRPFAGLSARIAKPEGT